MDQRCPQCGGPMSSSVEDFYCAELCGWSKPRTTPQIDIFGDEHSLAPAPAPRATGTHEQPRLFEPQYEGQLALAGGDNPEGKDHHE